MISDRESLEGFQLCCSINDLNDDTGKRFIVNNVEIAVFLIQNKAYAVSNICPHKHSALIYDGFVEGENVVCPAHGWTFNIKTGKTPAGNHGLDVYETVCVEDQVYVKVEEKKYFW
jgi:3-phenylpropionate/trans-cinnamate dioxygenase ferredoxin component